MKIFVAFFLILMCTLPSGAQEISPQEQHVASITRIVRHVAKGVVAPNQETLTPEQETLVTQIAQQLIQDAQIVQAEQLQLSQKQAERQAWIKTIVLNVAKGIAIIIALLVLREIIKSIGRGSAVESADTPIGVIITTRTTDQALELGKHIIDQKWATGGSITPTVQSLYRKDDTAYAAPEAMLMLKTTNQHLKDIVAQTELTDTSAPEIIAISRSIIPS